MVNQSFSQKNAILFLKSAQVIPLLKKTSQGLNVALSNRPNFKLPVLSKLSTVISHPNDPSFFSIHHSANRRHCSTETAVTKGYSDILCVANSGTLFSSCSQIFQLPLTQLIAVFCEMVWKGIWFWWSHTRLFQEWFEWQILQWQHLQKFCRKTSNLLAFNLVSQKICS